VVLKPFWLTTLLLLVVAAVAGLGLVVAGRVAIAPLLPKLYL
jgi:hypothetical protein